jgi:hypothetical protein
MKRNKLGILIVGAAMLAVTGFSSPSSAQVDINIGLFAPLPGFTFGAPPEVVVIPGSYVYYVPDVDFDVFFYDGYWYRPYRGYWYRSTFYNGPWGAIGPGFVPGPLIELPPRWRSLPRIHNRIPYERLHRDWRRWERERYWERNRGWRDWRNRWKRERGLWERERRQHFERERRDWERDRRNLPRERREIQRDRREIQREGREQRQNRRELQRERRQQQNRRDLQRQKGQQQDRSDREGRRDRKDQDGEGQGPRR